MTIQLLNIGKRFTNTQWLFRQFSYSFEQGNIYGIQGANGSGKTSLLLCLCNFYTLTEGQILWKKKHRIPARKYHHFFSICSPTLNIPEEWHVKELLRSHTQSHRHCPYGAIESETTVIKNAYLEKLAHLYVHELSSGSIQRLKLAMALSSTKPVLFLDEFTTHMDKQAKQWAHEQVRLQKDKLIIISSNEEEELAHTQTRLSLPFEGKAM